MKTSFEPFFKSGDRVEILPMTKRMYEYSCDCYETGDLCIIQGLMPHYNGIRDDDSEDARCYRYTAYFPKYDTERYVLESMIMPIGTVPNKMHKPYNDSGEILDVIRPMGHYNGYDHYYIRDGKYERIIKGLLIDL